MTNDTLRLRWAGEASDWNEALPIGNGRIGGMVFGGPSGRLQVNDSTVWSGDPGRGGRELEKLVSGGAGPELLAEVRAAIDAHDYRRADELLYSFEAPWSQEFLPFADVEVVADGPVRDVVRELDLDLGLVEETLVVGDVRVRRRWYASYPAEAAIIEIESDAPLDWRIRISTPLREERRARGANSLALGVAIPVDGAPLHEPTAPAHTWVDAGIDGFDPYGAIAVAATADGTVDTLGDVIKVVKSTRVRIAVTTATNAGDWWNSPDRTERLDETRRPALVDRAMAAASRVSDDSSDVLASHVADLASLLRATELRVGRRRGGTHDVDRLLRDGDDALVATVLFQFGRYLLASASRPGGPPANLQGIWNDQLRPAWSSNYTININTQMNYWGAITTGLDETQEPLTRLLERLAVTGSETADRLYGARGWVAHHNSDMWGWSLPVGAGHGSPSWAIWMMGGLWLCDNLWQQWSITRDETFLRERAWPILLGAAEFALDWLTDDGEGGLRTTPSTSPENWFRGPSGTPESLAVSSTMDIALIRATFERVLSAADVLGEGPATLEEIATALQRLPEFGITSGGGLYEWGEDHEEADPTHRHIAQMVAVYPLGQIDPIDTPALAAAASRTLDVRGNGAMGWSWAWKMALRARLGDGETARQMLIEASAPFSRDTKRFAPVDGSEWGGLLPNLFSTHPPFQIDGNYGFVAGILETIVSTREGELRLLPALPAAWDSGSVRSVRLPGGLAVDMEWSGAEVQSVRIHRLAAGSLRHITVRLRDEVWEIDLTQDVTELDTLPLRVVQS
jgi:alpha-L-fucosidase 2